MKFEEFYYHLTYNWLLPGCKLMFSFFDSKQFRKRLEGVVE